VLLATDRESYGNLSELITTARRAVGKGRYRLTRADVERGAGGCLALWVPRAAGVDEARAPSGMAGAGVSGCGWIAVELLRDGRDPARLTALQALGAASGVPLVAAGNVHMHVRSRRPLQDLLTAIRLKTTVVEAVAQLHPNGERCLRSRLVLARLYRPSCWPRPADR